LGFNQTVYRKEVIFAFALRCEKRFRYLAEQFPNLKAIFDSLFFAVEMGRLNETTSGQTFTTARLKEPDGALQRVNLQNWIGSLAQHFAIKKRDAESIDPSEEIELDFIAMIWLKSCIFKNYPGQLSTLQKSLQAMTHGIAYSIVTFTILIKPDDEGIGILEEGYTKHGVDAWVSAWELKKLRTEVEWSRDQNLCLVAFSTESELALVIEESVAVSAVKKNSRNYSSNLSERELLKTNWFFPTKLESKKLQDFFRDHLKDSATQAADAMLIALAISTFRSVEEVLKMRFGKYGEIVPNGHDAITYFEEKMPAYKPRAFFWEKYNKNSGEKIASIRLPNIISDYLLAYLPSTGYVEIFEILPKHLRENPFHCYEQIRHIFPNRPHLKKLILRDYLSRLMYSKTSNSALIRYFQGDGLEKNERSERLALSFYLNFENERAIDPYVDGCKYIFGKYGSREGTDFQNNLNQLHLSFEEIRNAVKYMEQEFATENLIQVGEIPKKQDEAVDILINQHNQFTRYTLFFVLALTGHRQTKTPFYFPWDFNFENDSIFIADKQTTGSEARFVPMCGLLRQQFSQYIQHLNAVSNMDEFSNEVREHARSLSAYFSFEKKHNELCASYQTPPIHGLFFHIRTNGHGLQTIATNKIDSVLAQFNKNFTKRLRATLAQYLWENGCSGRDVQTFLGQHPERHSFGPESNLVFDAWSINISNLIDEYAKANRFNIVASPFKKLTKEKIQSSAVIPHPYLAQNESAVVEKYTIAASDITSLEAIDGIAKNQGVSNLKPPTNNSYEVRHLDSAWASVRVRALVRQELDEAIFSNEETEISQFSDKKIPFEKVDTNRNQLLTEDEVQVLKSALKKTIQDRYPNDLLAQRKLEEELSRYFQEHNKRGRPLTSAASINLSKTQPGPIEVGFSRALRLATVHHRIWKHRVGSAIADGLKGKTKSVATVKNKSDVLITEDLSVTERLAHIAISLVCFDAVLVPLRVEKLIQALDAWQGVKFYKDAISVRANIESNRFSSDYSVIPTGITSALIARLPRDSDTSIQNSENHWKKINGCISKILFATLGSRADRKEWTLIDLCSMYRAYWHLHLPGTLHAIASGDFCGPAPLEVSETSLFGDKGDSEFPVVQSKKIKAADSNIQNEDEQKKSAHKAVRKLLTKARGQFELGTKNNRHQRAELSKIFKDVYASELESWIYHKQVIELLVSYIKRLYMQGGARNKTLAFSSIEKYFSEIAEAMIDLAWDCDFEAMNAADFNVLYRGVKTKLENKTGDCTGLLKIFHACARDIFNAPYCRLWADVTTPSHSRSTLFTAQMIDNAIGQLAAEKNVAAVLVACAYGYGLRRSEALALEAKNIDAEDGISIEKNSIRKLKSSNSRRYISSTFNNVKTEKIITLARNRAAGSSASKKYLFESTESNEVFLASSNKLAQTAIHMLRHVSGNEVAVLHDLRHTYATGLMLLTLCPKPKLAITQKAMQLLLGDDVNNSWQNKLAILDLPFQWPFSTDAVARALGHSSIETLLNTYFHGSQLAIAEYTHAIDNVSSMTDEWFATLIGKGRSTVTKTKEKTEFKENSLVSRKLSILPKFHTENYNAIQPNFHKTGLSKSNKKGSTDGIGVGVVRMESVTVDKLPWYFFDQLLSVRCSEILDLEITKENAIEQYGIEENAVESFFKKYSMLAKLGINDFEHEDSRLAMLNRSRTKSMVSGMEARKNYLKKMCTAFFENSNFEENFCEVLKRWFENLNGDDPALICYTITEFEQTKAVLQALDIEPDSCSLIVYGALPESFKEKTLYKYSNCKTVEASYAVRKVKTLKTPSVRIRVKSERKNAASDRNFHLALMIAFCACAS
jgi:Phage integrase family